MENIGFIGTGNIGSGMIARISSFKDSYKIFCYDKNCNNYDLLKKYNVCLCELNELIKNCRYIVLAIKPQDYSSLFGDIKSYIPKDIVIISLAAGIGEDFVSSCLGFCPKFVQVMPNTPILLGCGAVAMAKGSTATKEEFKFSVDIFSKAGIVCEVAPKDINYVIPINGSSPAFIYLFAKSFLDYAKEKEIDEDKALKLFCHSLIGSAKMMLESGKTIDKLIEDVSSKKGTTIEGLNFLRDNGFEEIIKKTCEKTAKRAFELSK